jgi:hypothetical protein
MKSTPHQAHHTPAFLPDYATNLLFAAKRVLYVPPEDYSIAIKDLDCAVDAFEQHMPVTKEGDLFTESFVQSLLLTRGQQG